MRRSSVLALLAAAALAGALTPAARAAEPPAQAAAAVAPAKPMDAAERKAVVEKLASTLSDYFVFPDVGARYAAMLKSNLASGAYDGLADPDAFAAKVTADLQAVSSDGHLRLATDAYWQSKFGAPGPKGEPARPLGLEETRMIGKVAYLRFSLFPDDHATAARARAFLLAHADAQAVIIDSRPNHGGGLEIMNAILPLFYARQTTLVRMDTRASAADSGPVEDGLTPQPSPPGLARADHVISPDPTETRLRNVPLYYLTSSKTASAAEHLALAFRHTHRAVQIGETTRGAGHYGGVLPIAAGFSAFIPVGRTYDPDTGWDWEGKGVAPDVAVPADQALDEALKRAKAAGADVG